MDEGEKKRGRHQDGDGDASSSGQRRRLCDASRTTVGGDTAHSHDTTKPFPDRVTAAAHGGRDVEEERVVDYRDGDAAGSCGHQRGVCASGSTLEETAESSRSRGVSSEEDEDEEEEEGGGVEGDGNDGRYSDDGLGLRVEHISVEECAFLYDVRGINAALHLHVCGLLPIPQHHVIIPPSSCVWHLDRLHPIRHAAQFFSLKPAVLAFKPRIAGDFCASGVHQAGHIAGAGRCGTPPLKTVNTKPQTINPKLQALHRQAGQGDVLDVGANIGLFSLFAHKEMQSKLDPNPKS